MPFWNLIHPSDCNLLHRMRRLSRIGSVRWHAAISDDSMLWFAWLVFGYILLVCTMVRPPSIAKVGLGFKLKETCASLVYESCLQSPKMANFEDPGFRQSLPHEHKKNSVLNPNVCPLLQRRMRTLRVRCRMNITQSYVQRATVSTRIWSSNTQT